MLELVDDNVAIWFGGDGGWLRLLRTVTPQLLMYKEWRDHIVAAIFNVREFGASCGTLVS